MTFKSRILGYFAYYITLLLRLTVRVVICKHSEYNPKTQYLFAFWHGKQLLPVLELQNHDTPRAVLVSPSRDGDILTVWLKNLGYEIVRGSSRKQNIRGLAGMIRKLRKGYSLGFGIDGPIGPIYKVKPGMTHMAQKLQVPIIPVGSAFSRSWVFEKAWDKYEIPKPFSKAVFYLGKPFIIEKEAELAISNDMLEGLIIQAEITAKTLL